METSLYKYTIEENEYVSSPRNKLVMISRNILFGVLALIIVLSLFLQENLFSGMSLGVKFFFFAILIASLFADDRRQVPAKLEITFYQDYMQFYRPKKNIDKYYVMETLTIYYRDIEKILWVTSAKKTYIHSKAKTVRYKYNNNGDLIEKPVMDKEDNLGAVIRMDFVKDADWISIFEKYTGKKVEIK